MNHNKIFHTTYKQMEAASEKLTRVSQWKPNFIEVMDLVMAENGGKLKQQLSKHYPYLLTDQDFAAVCQEYPIQIHFRSGFGETSSDSVEESVIFPQDKDVYELICIPYMNMDLHSHDFFEICYVYSGSCLQKYEGGEKQLKTGEICIVSPYSMHTTHVEKGSLVFLILIRSSTFLSMFWNLMARDDEMSAFFRRSLRVPRHSNYLFFRIRQDDESRFAVQRLLWETNNDDLHSNDYAVSLAHQLLICSLRKCTQTGQLLQIGEGEGSRFDNNLLLQYLQQNYSTVTLTALAKDFHYSEPHMSKLILKLFGRNLSVILQELKLRHAEEYLANTSMKISEITETVGFDSVDYFSRLFKRKLGMTPSEYRAQR